MNWLKKLFRRRDPDIALLIIRYPSELDEQEEASLINSLRAMQEFSRVPPILVIDNDVTVEAIYRQPIPQTEKDATSE